MKAEAALQQCVTDRKALTEKLAKCQSDSKQAAADLAEFRRLEISSGPRGYMRNVIMQDRQRP